MRVLVTGAAGMLARAILEDVRSLGGETIALTRRELDVTDPDAVLTALTRHRPDAVIQCAAFTAVDEAETREDEAFRVNAMATRSVALACRAIGARLVYPSTDYVFAGNSSTPYRPDDPTAPINAYGRSKLAGEEAAALAERCLVVRTSWLYGPGGPNFVETMLRLAERDVIRVVADQHGRPTSTATLAGAIMELLAKDADGTFHVTDGGEPTTWHDFAHAILETVGASHKLEAIPTSEYPRPAVRPAYSVLELSKTEAVLGRQLPDWRHTVRQYLLSRRAAVPADSA